MEVDVGGGALERQGISIGVESDLCTKHRPAMEGCDNENYMRIGNPVVDEERT